VFYGGGLLETGDSVQGEKKEARTGEVRTIFRTKKNPGYPAKGFAWL